MEDILLQSILDLLTDYFTDPVSNVTIVNVSETITDEPNSN